MTTTFKPVTGLKDGHEVFVIAGHYEVAKRNGRLVGAFASYNDAVVCHRSIPGSTLKLRMTDWIDLTAYVQKNLAGPERSLYVDQLNAALSGGRVQ